MKALFQRKSGAGYVLFGIVAASFGLIYTDTTTRHLDALRYVIGSVVGVGQIIVDSPYRLSVWFAEAVATRANLLARLDDLRVRNVELARLAGSYEALKSENGRMRELLGSRARLSDEVLVAELIGVVPNPETRQVIIDKGANRGVRTGQAVIDTEGLFGQVVETHRATARVLLIADIGHAVPVEVNRNGLRGIAAGTGRMDLLQLENVPVTADIRVGDLLVSSGLGGRFPRGYAVGRVASVVTDRSLALMRVGVKPSAMLSRSRYLLVIFDTAAGERR